jgi:hypothetical protein
MVKNNRIRTKEKDCPVGRPKRETPVTNVTIRIPLELKQGADRLAKEENRSLSNMIVVFVTEGIKARQKRAGGSSRKR